MIICGKPINTRTGSVDSVNFSEKVFTFFRDRYIMKSVRNIWASGQVLRTVSVENGRKFQRDLTCCTKGIISFLHLTQNVMIALDLCDILSYNNSK